MVCTAGCRMYRPQSAQIWVFLAKLRQKYSDCAHTTDRNSRILHLDRQKCFLVVAPQHLGVVVSLLVSILAALVDGLDSEALVLLLVAGGEVRSGRQSGTGMSG